MSRGSTITADTKVTTKLVTSGIEKSGVVFGRPPFFREGDGILTHPGYQSCNSNHGARDSFRLRRRTHVSGSQMKNTSPSALVMIALSIAILATASCARAGATKAHVRAMKPAPRSAQPGSASRQNSDTESVTPRVWELTALAARKGLSVAS
jgi:hypothetical protein